jgi:hypothetical protein
MQNAGGRSPGFLDDAVDSLRDESRMTERQRAKDAADKKARLAAEAVSEAAAASGAKKISKAQRDRDSDASRGPPPAPERSFRAPAALLPDIITVWELVHVSHGSHRFRV